MGNKLETVVDRLRYADDAPLVFLSLATVGIGAVLSGYTEWIDVIFSAMIATGIYLYVSLYRYEMEVETDAE